MELNYNVQGGDEEDGGYINKMEFIIFILIYILTKCVIVAC